MNKIKDFIIGFLMIHIFWLISALLLNLHALPGPILVYSRMGEVIKGDIFLHIFASLGRIAAGLIISLAIGLPLGILMAKSPKWNKVLHPVIYFSYPIPKTALLPVAMLLLGLGNGSKILIMVLTMVFQIIITVRDAVTDIPAEIYQVGKSAGLPQNYLLRHVTLPAILPELFTGLRISTGTAMAILFIVEAYGTKAGVGYYILDSWSRINYPQMYGGIVVIAVLGAMLFLMIDLLADNVCKWNRK